MIGFIRSLFRRRPPRAVSYQVQKKKRPRIDDELHKSLKADGAGV